MIQICNIVALFCDSYSNRLKCNKDCKCNCTTYMWLRANSPKWIASSPSKKKNVEKKRNEPQKYILRNRWIDFFNARKGDCCSPRCGHSIFIVANLLNNYGKKKAADEMKNTRNNTCQRPTTRNTFILWRYICRPMVISLMNFVGCRSCACNFIHPMAIVYSVRWRRIERKPLDCEMFWGK